MPLLWVAARYGSDTAKWNASIILSITSRPSSLLPDFTISSGGNLAVILLNLKSAKLDKILSATLPLVSSSKSGAINSDMVLTAFAPIASLQSTCKCTISIFPILVSITLVIMSLQPPPREIILLGRELHLSSNSCFA